MINGERRYLQDRARVFANVAPINSAPLVPDRTYRRCHLDRLIFSDYWLVSF